jgi:hypothetical protein
MIMRDTPYATELATASLSYGQEEARIEKIHVKDAGQDEIRFSWWKNGNIVPRPLDIPEDDFLKLLETGFGSVLSDEFLVALKAKIEVYLWNKILKQ